MPDWNAHVPDFTVKDKPDRVTAEAAAEKRIASHKAGLTVAKIAVPSPPPPPPAAPSFLVGKKPIFTDDCSAPDPLAARRWRVAGMENRSHIEESTQWPAYTDMSRIQPGRFRQFPNGGPHDRPYYHFTAPSGDNMWTNRGVYGRSELGYPASDPRSGLPNHPGPSGAIFRYEGDTTVDLMTVRLPSGWDVNAQNWRVICQWKQNEWVDTGGLSPVMSFQQRGGYWVVCNEPRGVWEGDDVIWKHPAVAGNWISFAHLVTWSEDPTKGKVQVFADADLDGVYEVQGPILTTQTLLTRPGGGPGVEAMTSIGCYEGTAGDSVDVAPGSTGGIDIWS